MLGQAALAMWWDMAPEMRAEFEHWHTHEHFPERLGVPGFLRASRWADAEGGPGFFILYELESHDVLSSPGYRARLDAPTPWSQRLMPYHANMVRCQTRVLQSVGGVTARHALTQRFEREEGEAVSAKVAKHAGEGSQQPGIVGVHLLQTDTPAMAPTQEQRIRGLADATADFVLILTGYDPAALRACVDGAASLYAQSASMTPADVGGIPTRP